MKLPEMPSNFKWIFLSFKSKIDIRILVTKVFNSYGWHLISCKKRKFSFCFLQFKNKLIFGQLIPIFGASRILAVTTVIGTLVLSAWAGWQFGNKIAHVRIIFPICNFWPRGCFCFTENPAPSCTLQCTVMHLFNILSSQMPHQFLVLRIQIYIDMINHTRAIITHSWILTYNARI